MFVAGETSLLIDKSVVFPYKLLLRHTLSGRNSAVECQLPKLDVTGSIPVARSNFFPQRLVFKTFKSFKMFKSFSPVVQIVPAMLNFFNMLNDLELLRQTGNL